MPLKRMQAWMRRHALGLWLCMVAAMGVVETARIAFPQGRFAGSTVAWLWLMGTAVVALAAIAVLVREQRRGR